MQKELSTGRNMLWNSAGSFIYLGCQWAITVLVVRLSDGYDGAGTLALAMAISNVFAPVAHFRVRPYQVSDVRHAIDDGEYVVFRLLSIGLSVVLVFFYTVITCDSSSLVPVMLFFVFRAVDLFFDVFHAIDQRNNRMDYCGKSSAVRGVLILLSFSIVLYATNDLNLAIASMTAVTLPVLLYDVPKAKSFGPIRVHLSRKHALKLFRDCLPSVIGMVGCIAVVSVARQYLSFVEGDVALGIYASVCTPVVIVQAGANYIYAPLLVSFAKYYDERKIGAFKSLLFKILALTLLFTLLASVAFLLFGDFLLGIAFGADIVQYSYLLYPAMVSAALTALIAFASDLLVVVRDPKGNLICNLLSFVSCIPCTLLFVPLCGMNGTSYAIAVSYAVGLVAMLVCLRKKLLGRVN